MSAKQLNKTKAWRKKQPPGVPSGRRFKEYMQSMRKMMKPTPPTLVSALFQRAGIIATNKVEQEVIEAASMPHLQAAASAALL